MDRAWLELRNRADEAMRSEPVDAWLDALSQAYEGPDEDAESLADTMADLAIATTTSGERHAVAKGRFSFDVSRVNQWIDRLEQDVWQDAGQEPEHPIRMSPSARQVFRAALVNDVWAGES